MPLLGSPKPQFLACMCRGTAGAPSRLGCAASLEQPLASHGLRHCWSKRSPRMGVEVGAADACLGCTAPLEPPLPSHGPRSHSTWVCLASGAIAAYRATGAASLQRSCRIRLPWSTSQLMKVDKVGMSDASMSLHFFKCCWPNLTQCQTKLQPNKGLCFESHSPNHNPLLSIPSYIHFPFPLIIQTPPQELRWSGITWRRLL